jgi:phosphate transport system substrate-binding protein
MTKRTPGILAILALLPLFSLGHAAGSTEPLVWAGCGITKKAFMSELAAAFTRKTGIEIILEGGGATKGIRRINENSVHLGGTCRPKLPGHQDEASAELIPVAWDALAVIVHKDNDIDEISLEQLRDLYQGRIKTWKQLGGRDRPVDLLVRKGKISGVGLTLRELIFHNPDEQFVSANVFPSSGPLEKAVEKNINAIGVTGISSAKRRDVKILKLAGKEPNYDTVRSGEYLLYRPLYIAINATSARYADVKRFSDFAHSRAGREVIRNAGTVPYLEAIRLVHKQREQWKAARNTQR